jgi:acyl dehydratase
LKIHQTYSHRFSFSQEQVKAFAEITGDTNPLHLDENYAAATPFGKPIIHGMLAGSVFSKILGTLFPGEGTVYVQQTLEFRRPMFVEVEYEAVLTVKDLHPARHQATISTQIKEVVSQKETLRGEAVVMNAEAL